MSIEHFERSIRISPLDPFNFNAFIGIGASHFGAARYEECARWVQKGIAARPSATFAYRILAPALAHLGRLDEARQAIAALLQAHPDATVSKVVDITPNTVPEFVTRYSAGLRKAGLPE